MATNKQVARSFVNNGKPVRSQHMSIDGPILYSYETAVALRSNRAVIVSDERYSNSTSKQLGSNSTSKQLGFVMSECVWAGIPFFRVPVPHSGRQFNPLPTGSDCLAVIVREWYRRLVIARDAYQQSYQQSLSISARPASVAKRERELIALHNGLSEFTAFYGLDYADCGIPDWE